MLRLTMISGALCLQLLASGVMAQAREIHLPGPTVRLSDVVEANALPIELSEPAMDVVVAEAQHGQSLLVLTGEDIALAARKRMPILSRYVEADHTRPVRVHLDWKPAARSPDAKADDDRCAELLITVQAGKAVRPGDVKPAKCPVHRLPGSALRYEQWTHTSYAVTSMEQGAILARPVMSSLDYVAGDPVVIVERLGQVSVSRTVRANQAGRFGSRISVSASDQNVFSAVVDQAGGNR
ncbi:flagella basal body P-ring formation protein FlgA [Burkholderia ubonensis]|uniref:flagella basal body P-ring formation protein FlgA n=1 Tax=Burkholderia ubonensis TaxID=101571 RepID=UPI0009B3E799|nr:flagella basal body P-ring formation protein FlgA [Burkholderia ubonensis]